MTAEPLTLAAALLIGLMGSGHCVGMCGAMAVLPAAAGGRVGWGLVTYNAARGTSYAILGAAAGGLGAGLGEWIDVPQWSAVMRVGTGVVLALVGLTLATGRDRLAFAERVGASLWRRVSPLAVRLMGLPAPPRLVGLGLLWGLLPCGLVYSVLLAASLAGSAAGGALTMLAFALGTLPALLGVGLAGRAMAARFRLPRYRRAVGIVLVVCGVWLAVVPMWPVAGHGHSHHTMSP